MPHRSNGRRKSACVNPAYQMRPLASRDSESCYSMLSLVLVARKFTGGWYSGEEMDVEGIEGGGGEKIAYTDSARENFTLTGPFYMYPRLRDLFFILQKHSCIIRWTANPITPRLFISWSLHTSLLMSHNVGLLQVFVQLILSVLRALFRSVPSRGITIIKTVPWDYWNSSPSSCTSTLARYFWIGATTWRFFLFLVV